MHAHFLRFFIIVLCVPKTTSFLTAPASTLWNYTRRNLFCTSGTVTLYNGTTDFQNNTPIIIADYCLIAITTSLVNNLTETVTRQGGIYLWNTYRNIAIHQCNFSRTMDIGYGSCTPYYYETAISIQLCICSTNNCSATYASCQASVNQALSSSPPLLPVLQPTLSNTITCQDFLFNNSVTNNIIPPRYQGCALMIGFGKPDFLKCSVYTPNHTVMCGVNYDPGTGSYAQMAFIEGDYEIYLGNVIFYGANISMNSSGYYEYETSTSIAVIISTPQWYYAQCLCTTNNCNVNFATCTNGMNIPSYLVSYNGSTSTTAATTGTSTGITMSTPSTTRSTSTASRSNITTVQSSSTTSGTTSVIFLQLYYFYTLFFSLFLL